MKKLIFALVFSVHISAAMASQWGDRLSVESPWFHVQESDIDLHQSISGFDPIAGERVSNLTIGLKALEMIEAADQRIISSVFLFDNMYSKNEPQWDIVKAMTSALEQKRKTHPNIKMTMIFGPLMRAYADRIAPAVERLLKVGVDVFYSDLLPTKAHTPYKVIEAGHHTMRGIGKIPGVGLLVRGLKKLSYVPIPFTPKLDGERASLGMAFNAGLIKANHRKILVTQSQGKWEALVSSANPHNASIPSTNYATSVKGPLAEYIYDVLRSDVQASIKMKSKDYVLWNDDADKNYKKSFLTEMMPDVDRHALNVGDVSSNVKVKFLTEQKIEKEAVRVLNEVQEGDQVRIQMFYLSDYDMIRAILRASTLTSYPVQLLLDPNKDAFNKIKDGTPNRQVAAFLMRNVSDKDMKKLKKYFPEFVKNGKLQTPAIDIRWYNTTGEQNHAKIMSITNPVTGKFVMLNGSANWTGKNLNDVNMEANLLTDGAIQATTKFNDIFDRLFSNTDGIIYSLDYYHETYSRHAGIKKWINGENRGFVSW